MLDAKTLIDTFTGQEQSQTGAHDSRPTKPSLSRLLDGKAGLATGAVAGGLAGLLLGGKKPKKMAQSALKLGGMAVVGGLAYKAWQDWQSKSSSSGSVNTMIDEAEGSVFLPETERERHDLSRALIRAMITAAKADGHITPHERQRIETQLSSFALEHSDESFIKNELAGPMDISAVAASAKTPEQAAEIYAASLLAIDPDGAAEKGYLAVLAAQLKLDADLVSHLHAQADGLVQSSAS